jgi:predicted HicB family RNase H-like nuclease
LTDSNDWYGPSPAGEGDFKVCGYSSKESKMSISENSRAVKLAAQSLYCKDPDWVTFYREVMGLGGLIRQHFVTLQSLAQFEQTDDFQEIQQMLSRLRARGPVASDPNEPTRVITVRLPKSLHESLRIEAFEHRTSMNKLCISKLVQFIDDLMVPAET